jgi:hypothetical protein
VHEPGTDPGGTGGRSMSNGDRCEEVACQSMGVLGELEAPGAPKGVPGHSDGTPLLTKLVAKKGSRDMKSCRWGELALAVDDSMLLRPGRVSDISVSASQ